MTSVVHFSSLRITLVDLWYPIGCITITDLGERQYLFQFFLDVDLKRVLAGMPWFFNNHLILFHELRLFEDPLTISNANFWIQIHELLMRLMSDAMVKCFGNFLSDFLEYNTKVTLYGIQRYMHMWVRLDVRLPLK